MVTFSCVHRPRMSHFKSPSIFSNLRHILNLLPISISVTFQSPSHFKSPPNLNLRHILNLHHILNLRHIDELKSLAIIYASIRSTHSSILIVRFVFLYYLFSPTATFIGYNKSGDLFRPITVAVCKKLNV